MKSRICSVTFCSAKSKGWEVILRKGVPRRIMDWTCALIISCAQDWWGFPMSVWGTYLIFPANKIADLLGILDACLCIAVDSRLKDAEPVVHKLFGVFSRRPKVYQLDLLDVRAQFTS